MFAMNQSYYKMGEQMAARQMLKSKQRHSEEDISLARSLVSNGSSETKKRNNSWTDNKNKASASNKDISKLPSSITCTDTELTSATSLDSIESIDEANQTALAYQNVLKEVQKSIASQEDQAQELQATYQSHVLRAQARLEAGNEMGAIISMKKVQQLELQRTEIEQSISYLKAREEELQGFLSQEKSETSEPLPNEEGATEKMTDQELLAKLKELDV